MNSFVVRKVMLFNLIKRIFDIFFSIILLLILTPVFFLIILINGIFSKGPIFFRQERLGLNCQVFKIIKFRSMVVGAEKMEEGLFNQVNDRRVTKFGSFLRKTSLDELPQLINILKGEMSFVGPRPPVTYELGKVENFSEEIKQVFTVKPGVTGLAQVSGRNELCWDDKIKYNLYYIDTFKRYGVFYDFYIIFLTVIKVFKMDGSYEHSHNVEKDKKRLDK